MIEGVGLPYWCSMFIVSRILRAESDFQSLCQAPRESASAVGRAKKCTWSGISKNRPTTQPFRSPAKLQISERTLYELSELRSGRRVSVQTVKKYKGLRERLNVR